MNKWGLGLLSNIRGTLTLIYYSYRQLYESVFQFFQGKKKTKEGLLKFKDWIKMSGHWI